MGESKTIKFMFKDSDKNDLVGFDFVIPVGTTWMVLMILLGIIVSGMLE